MMKINNIKKRISVRSYNPKNIDSKLFERVQMEVNKKRIGPFGNIISFILINTDDDKLAELGKMTSYGIIKGTSLYIGGYCDSDDNTIIDYGYCFEELVLELTALNIGTCWLGGTFGRSFISKAMNLPEGKVIPGISPIGLANDKRSFSDKLVRKLAKADKRKDNSELFFKFEKSKGLYPILLENEHDNISTILEMLRIAPSASNKQPWRIIVENSTLNLFWDVDIKYNSMIKTHNIQALDMGIALCHLIHSTSDLGLKHNLEFFAPNITDVKWRYIASLKIEE